MSTMTPKEFNDKANKLAATLDEYDSALELGGAEGEPVVTLYAHRNGRIYLVVDERTLTVVKRFTGIWAEAETYARLYFWTGARNV